MSRNTLPRREFIQLAAWAAAGLLAAPEALAMSHEQHKFLIDNPDFTDQALTFFTPEQRALVTKLADLILPRTETPGAIDAKVPAFLELMVAEWMKDEERQTFMAGLADLETKGFMGLDEDAQYAELAALESAASDHPWYQLGNLVGRYFDSSAPFICQLKELTCTGFFQSEVGATEALAYNHVAGELEGRIPLEEGQPAWSSELFSV